MPEPTNPNPSDPNAGGQPGGGTPPAPSDPNANNNGGGQIDLATIPADQLAKVLENKELWNLPRIKELREKAGQADQLTKAQQEAETKRQREQGEFKELSETQAKTIEELQGQVSSMKQDQALTAALIKMDVVDLDAALKLVNRADIKISDTGAQGVEEAVKALQTDRGYLFKAGGGQPNVGTPSNPTGGQTPSGPMKFKRSQLRDQAFYKEHAKEIDDAYAKGLIEDDINVPRQPGQQ